MRADFDLITNYRVNEIRDAAAKRPEDSRIVAAWAIEYGGFMDRVTATGRARCRACGKRIEKGAPALKFAFDFRGSGSFTAVVVQIHTTSCN